MTRDEILKMKPGSELDILVAEKVLGWHRIEGPHYDYNGPCEYGDVLIPPTLSTEQAYSLMPPIGKVPLGYFVTQKYSTKISAAWEIIEKLLAQDFIPVIQCYGNLVTIYKETVNGIKTICMVCGSTVPEAICKAALLTKNVV